MDCPLCGFVLDPFAKRCPKCGATGEALTTPAASPGLPTSPIPRLPAPTAAVPVRQLAGANAAPVQTTTSLPGLSLAAMVIVGALNALLALAVLLMLVAMPFLTKLLSSLALGGVPPSGFSSASP